MPLSYELISARAAVQQREKSPESAGEIRRSPFKDIQEGVAVAK
jgi:hypothetical protein